MSASLTSLSPARRKGNRKDRDYQRFIGFHCNISFLGRVIEETKGKIMMLVFPVFVVKFPQNITSILVYLHIHHVLCLLTHSSGIISPLAIVLSLRVFSNTISIYIYIYV